MSSQPGAEWRHVAYGKPQARITRADVGTWLDGAQGWHNTYRVVDLAVSYGFELNHEEAVALDVFRLEEVGHPVEAWIVDDLSDKATDYLQSLVTDDDLYFVWDAGELSLQEVEDES